MPIYTFECPATGGREQFEVVRLMSEASEPYPCPNCGCPCNRVFGDFLFIEDRCRLARNPRTGENFSDMLGQPYPQDRVERDAIYAQKGIEPVSPGNLPKQWQTALDYRKHLDSGGAPVADTSALIEKPDMSGVKSIAQQLRESNFRMGV